MDENEQAVADLQAEATKLGITPSAKPTTEEKEEVEEKEEKSEDSADSEPSEEEPEEEAEPEEEDEEDEESDDEERDTRNPRKYIPVKKYQSEKAEWRSEKEQHLATISRLQENLDEISKKIPSENAESRKKLHDSIKALDPDFDPAHLDIVIDTIKDELKNTSGKISPELEEKVNALSAFMEENKQERLRISDERFFNKSWSGLLPQFSKDFPNATEEQKQEARKVMDEVWHSKEFHDKDIEYVYWKNKTKFDSLISPRKKGLETGRPQGHIAPKDGKVKLSVHPTSKELQAAEKALQDASASDDDLTELPSEL